MRRAETATIFLAIAEDDLGFFVRVRETKAGENSVAVSSSRLLCAS
jgi:hypothetical protein